MSILKWHYQNGIKFYLKVWKNFLWFVLYFFSVRRLFHTLFAPWRRSLLIKDWEGFHPIQALLFHITSGYFRFFGGLVRLAVIILGLAAYLLVILIGALTFLAWLLLPALIIFVIILFFQLPILALAILPFILLAIFLSIIGFHEASRKPVLEMDFEEIKNIPLINRILERANISKQEWEKIDFSGDFQPALKKLLTQKDLDLKDFNEIMNWERAREHINRQNKKFWTKQSLKKTLPIGSCWNYGRTPLLDKFSIDLSKNDPTDYAEIELINYDKEMEMINLAFSKDSQSSLILLGRPGIGKQSIIHYLAKKIRRNSVHPCFLYQRIIRIDLKEVLNAAVDSNKNPASLLDEIFYQAATAGNVILFIENLAQYFDSDSKLYGEVPGLLAKYLDYPPFRLMATCSAKDYHRFIENNENIIKNCKSLEVSEPKKQDVAFMLIQRLDKLEQSKIFLSYQTIREIIEKSSFLGKIMPLPGRAITLMDEVITYWDNNQTGEITPQTVNQVIELKTGVPQGVIDKKEKEQLLNLEEVLHKRIVGQDHAIRKVAQAIKQSRTEMGEGNKPVGSFLFLGPTGVGKTETAKALAEAYYGNEQRMIRFDMNEYQNEDSAGRLIGDSQTNTPGSLVSKVKDNPFSLILLDELEKAYPDVLDIFLRILDEGYAVDAFDEKVSFHGNIIIATSNAGSALIKEMVENNEEPEKIEKRLVDHLIEKNIYKVEFLNRFDDVVFYEPFTPEQLRAVIRLMLNRLADRLREDKNISINFSKEVIEKIIEEGYRPIFGARSIRRYINDKIETIITDKILKGELNKGSEATITPEDLS